MDAHTQTQDAQPLAVPDREVRRLLRSLSRPKSLESQALALLIKDHFGAANCHDAVMLFLRRIFSEYGREGRRLFDLLRRTDMEGMETHAAIAASMNLSTRQFYRYRSNAVHIIVRGVRDLLAQSKDEPLTQVLARSMESIDPGIALELHALNLRPNAAKSGEVERLRARLTGVLENAGKSADATELAESIRRRVHFHDNEHRSDVLAELAYHDYLIARYRSDSDACGEALKQLRNNATASRRAEALSALCEAEASFRFFHATDGLGKLRAAATLACRLSDISLQCSAMLALAEALFCAGNANEAAQLVKSLELCTAFVPRINADVIALKNRLAFRGANLGVVSYEGPLRSYGETMLAVTWARNLFTRGDIERARAEARRILPTAEERGYRIPQMWCLALLGELSRARAILSLCDDALCFDAIDEPSTAVNGAVVHGLAVLALRKSRVA